MQKPTANGILSSSVTRVRIMAKTLSGFTLWECLLSLALIITLASSALPALQNHARTLALDTDRRQVQALLDDARRHALRYRQSVTLCPQSPSGACQADWSGSLHYFSTVHAAQSASPRQYHRSAPPAAPNVRKIRPRNRSGITFLADGRAPGSQGHIAFCRHAGAPAIGRIILAASGRNRYQAGDPGNQGCR